MAEINASLLDGVYYRTYRGRTIVCRKPQNGQSSRSGAQRYSSALFGMMSRYIGLHRASIQKNFDGVDGCEASEIFFKLNKAALREAFRPLLDEHMESLKEQKNADLASAYKDLPVEVKVNTIDFARRKIDTSTLPAERLEAAVTAYARAHPGTIVLAKKAGFQTLYLNGPWPETVGLHPIQVHTEITL
ncbi:MAG: hypothetical protein MJZ81_03735 [Bacteroidales bacterium]|nr:hypothetical protein [Bacteroidales bacterium]